ncbi:hypothetical protein HPB51_020681 [Rhipicephalus microplus]|uniref:Sodium-dependent multivitamin transporter n=1 Tax=Rhipicephalus microplus TaxID=6941 RepID=A0A9J6EV03_RHIMP|nr:hypothetical protein HPB51_020681 [Rhipicephalus microplus]
MTTEKRLEATDYAVFGTLTIAGFLVGLYFSIPRNSTREGGIEAASLGGRSLPTAALAVSVMASAANSLSVVSFVGHYYAHGFNLMWVLAGIPLAAYITAVSVVPLLYHLRVVSIFQGRG